MAKHIARVAWQLNGGDFLGGKYSREHTWTFDGGVVVPASPALSSVPVPYSNADCVDPEEAFVVAISSCHMLSFLYVAYRAGVEVLSYEDTAVGTMAMNEHNKKWVNAVELHPKIVYGRNPPAPQLEAKLHDEAHHECFIANSVKTDIRVAAAPR